MDDALLAPPQEGRAGTPQAGRRLSLLLVEDNPLVGHIICSAVEECGFTPIRTSSWQDFLEALETHAPDGVALDLSIPDCACDEILRTLADRSYRGLVVIVSGLDKGALASARKLGLRVGLRMAEPLAKPFRFDDLAERLSALEPLPAA